MYEGVEGDFDAISKNVAKSLFPRNAISQYNENLNRRYSGKKSELSNAHSLYEIDDLLKLSDSDSLEEHERNFVKDVQENDNTVEVINLYIHKAIEASKGNTRQDIKLFRTALFIYKNIIVNRPKVQSGAFKIALGPIGIDKTRDSYLDGILRKVGQISEWDGNIAKINDNPNIQHDIRKNLIRVKTIKEEESEQESFLKEVELLEELSEKLSPATFIPKISQKGQRSVYLEYIPFEFNPHKTKTFSSDFRAVTAAVELAWKEAGVINTDLKPNNIRKRENGEVVIIDWGANVRTSPAEKNFFPREITSGIFNYLPAEAIEILLNKKNNSIDVEKYLVFAIGITMVSSVYTTYNLDRVLSDGHGSKISKDIPGNMISDGFPNYSVDSKTAEELARRFPIARNDYLNEYIKEMLDEKPEKRPTLEEVKKFLASL